MRIQHRGYQAIFVSRERKKEREREGEEKEKKKDGEQNRKIQRVEYKHRNGSLTDRLGRRGAHSGDSDRKAEVGSPLRFAGTCT